MADVVDINRDISFTIDGEPFSTRDRRQTAAALLGLAGLSPSMYDLGELHGHSPQPCRFKDSDEVEIHPGGRFASIRQKADVA
ncbi:MAG TPA: hypothetical protein VNG13_13175 [Mycobacteriales bacterium]|nr:hypothetical protein [Mycobacteriales bacterium]